MIFINEKKQSGELIIFKKTRAGMRCISGHGLTYTRALKLWQSGRLHKHPLIQNEIYFEVL